METPSKIHWLTPKDIAVWLDITPETVRAWCRCGRLRACQAGRQYLIEPGDFEQFLRERRNVEHLTEIAP